MCFSWEMLGSILVALVIICLVLAIIRLVVPWLINLAGGGSAVGVFITVFTWIVWAAIAIWAIWFLVDLASCLLGGAGVGLHHHTLR